MKAERELDARVETEVFCNEVVERMCLQSYDCGTWEDAEDWYDGNLKENPGMSILPCVHDGIGYEPISHYSTQIADAWLVVEKMLTIFPLQDFHLEHLGGIGWRVGTCAEDEWYACAATAALAICLAALKAVKDKP